MDISVIFATCNRNDILAKTLRSFCGISSEGLQWETVVVDNAGSDETRELVESFSESLPVRYLVEKRRGKNRALNK